MAGGGDDDSSGWGEDPSDCSFYSDDGSLMDGIDAGGMAGDGPGSAAAGATGGAAMESAPYEVVPADALASAADEEMRALVDVLGVETWQARTLLMKHRWNIEVRSAPSHQELRARYDQ